MASTTDHGPPVPVPGQRTCSPHRGRLRVRQQRGGGKQRSDGICSAVLTAAAQWQRWQSGGGSASAARRWRAAQQWHRECEGGGGSASVAVAAAAAAQRRRAVGLSRKCCRHVGDMSSRHKMSLQFWPDGSVSPTQDLRCRGLLCRLQPTLIFPAKTQVRM
jgi:hypothetical protein